MFGVGIGGFDLNHATERYFDVILTLVSSKNRVKTKMVVPLEACTVDKWNISE